MTAPTDELYMEQQELIDQLLERDGGLGMAVMLWGCGPLTRLERRMYPSFSASVNELVAQRNKRSVWSIPGDPFDGAHYAVFPKALVEPCVRAGSRVGDLVLDPFSGAGTTGVVATRLQRSYVGIELNPAYAEMSRRRIADDAPLFNAAGVA